MLRNQTQKCLLHELVIGLDGSKVHRLKANDVPLLVYFDYEHGSSDGEDMPSLHNVVTTLAGETKLGGEDAELRLACGFCVDHLLTSQQSDKIEEEVLRLQAARYKESYEQGRIDAAENNKAERNAP